MRAGHFSLWESGSIGAQVAAAGIYLGQGGFLRRSPPLKLEPLGRPQGGLAADDAAFAADNADLTQQHLAPAVR